MILGIHVDNNGGHPALIAKVEETVWNRIYEKLRANPTPIEMPIPPFLFCEDNETPMIVRMNAAKGVARRL